jgi:hypothetical protein
MEWQNSNPPRKIRTLSKRQVRPIWVRLGKNKQLHKARQPSGFVILAIRCNGAFLINYELKNIYYSLEQGVL